MVQEVLPQLNNGGVINHIDLLSPSKDHNLHLEKNRKAFLSLRAKDLGFPATWSRPERFFKPGHSTSTTRARAIAHHRDRLPIPVEIWSHVSAALAADTGHAAVHRASPKTRRAKTKEWLAITRPAVQVAL
jgi:hypothetical protein